MVSTIYTIATQSSDKSDLASDDAGINDVDAEVSKWIVTVIDSVDQEETWSNRIFVFRKRAALQLKKLISHQVSMISCHDACFS